MVPALRIARDLVRDGARRVLIVSEDRFERPYTAQPPSERGYAELTSDAGSAVLVDSDGQLELAAFGFATRAHDWDYWNKYHEFHDGRLPAEALPDPIGVAHEEVATRRAALERCLRAARLGVEQAEHFSLPERVRAPMLSLARQLGIAAEKVVPARYGHMGRSDVVFDIEQLLGEPSPQPVLQCRSDDRDYRRVQVRCAAVGDRQRRDFRPRHRASRVRARALALPLRRQIALASSFDGDLSACLV